MNAAPDAPNDEEVVLNNILDEVFGKDAEGGRYLLRERQTAITSAEQHKTNKR